VTAWTLRGQRISLCSNAVHYICTGRIERCRHSDMRRVQTLHKYVLYFRREYTIALVVMWWLCKENSDRRTGKIGLLSAL